MSLPIKKREMRRRLRAIHRRTPLAAVAAALLLAILATWALTRLGNTPAEPPVPVVAGPGALEIIPPEPTSAAEGPEETLVWREGVFDPKKPFYNQLTDLGLEGGLIHALIQALTPVYDFRKARPQHQWRLAFRGGAPARLSLCVSPVEIYDIADLEAGALRAVRRDIQTYTQLEVVRGRIETSLYQSLDHAPKSVRLAAKMEEVFAWEIDFYQDPRAGDAFDLLVEKIYLQTADGPTFHDYGRIMAARYVAGDDVIDGYYFELKPGEGAYFNAKGESLIRDVLRSPIKLQRVTSNFNPRRFHPILKKRLPHNGVDYGADKNTPVMSVANGSVEIAGWYGGAGRAVVVRHKGELQTQYFHLNKIAKGVRRGARVKQGQVIGYVGKTGMATSYHLHFGMKIRGRYVNPLKQKFQKGEAVPSDRRASFQQWAAHWRQMLEPLEPQAVMRAQHQFPLFKSPTLLGSAN